MHFNTNSRVRTNLCVGATFNFYYLKKKREKSKPKIAGKSQERNTDLHRLYLVTLKKTLHLNICWFWNAFGNMRNRINQNLWLASMENSSEKIRSSRYAAAATTHLRYVAWKWYIKKIENRIPQTVQVETFSMKRMHK